MLVLTRKELESLLIGNDIKITVLIIDPKKIKLLVQIQGKEDLVTNKRVGTTNPITDDITIKIVDIDQKQVKFGIKAPKEVKIERVQV